MTRDVYSVKSMKKQRLDLLLVERHLAETRTLAQRLIMAGQVRVDGQVFLKPSSMVSPQSELSIDQGSRFVSRGGEKLAAALEAFPIEIKERICADVGASTGGFTDCLLQNGAKKVYAIDVGSGILHWKLRQDVRVIVMEGTNARYLKQLPELVNLVTIDASFISLKVLLPVIYGWLEERSDVIALIKPQFEAGRQQAARGDGVIRDPETHRNVIREIVSFAQEKKFVVRGMIRSPLAGPKGNIEFFLWLEKSVKPVNHYEDSWIEAITG
jgi:23S rRNA (cytidine1920-2'-O)/16S rRNA (cytidine1409-2'-O)-methyltransferase